MIYEKTDHISHFNLLRRGAARGLAKTFEREPLPSLPKWVEISSRFTAVSKIDRKRNDEFVRAEPEGALYARFVEYR
jgi:hypothetical protein